MINGNGGKHYPLSTFREPLSSYVYQLFALIDIIYLGNNGTLFTCFKGFIYGLNSDGQGN